MLQLVLACGVRPSPSVQSGAVGGDFRQPAGSCPDFFGPRRDHFRLPNPEGVSRAKALVSSQLYERFAAGFENSYRAWSVAVHADGLCRTAAGQPHRLRRRFCGIGDQGIGKFAGAQRAIGLIAAVGEALAATPSGPWRATRRAWATPASPKTGRRDSTRHAIADGARHASALRTATLYSAPCGLTWTIVRAQRVGPPHRAVRSARARCARYRQRTWASRAVRNWRGRDSRGGRRCRTPRSIARRAVRSMVASSPACPPQAMLAEVICSIRAASCAESSSSPMSQFRSIISLSSAASSGAISFHHSAYTALRGMP